MPSDAATGVIYIAPSPHKQPPTSTSVRSQGKGAPTSKPNSLVPHPSIIRSLLLLLPILTIWPWWCKNLHYELPAPVLNGSPEHGLPVVSEINIISHVQRLEDIGYRVIGTEEAVEGEQYVYDVMQNLLAQCTRSHVLECSLWMQEGDGMHQFDIMSHAVLKSYRGIRNVIFRVSGVNTTTSLEGESLKNHVLLNSHIDSALPSKGSADDGLGVGVMAELARVLVERDQHIIGGVIFLFNGAEESLQDASHLYSTQHETRHDVKAVINLEAAGTTGGAFLFQATAQEMVNAYAHVPRPHGNVIALEVFQSGIIMSDTDFRQFEQYLAVPGLDFSLVGNSYYYHTRRDTVENIEVGAAQHFGDTILAILDHLLKPGSPLNTDTPWSPLNSVFYSLYDRVYVQYSMRTADLLCGTLVATFVALFVARTRKYQRTIYYKAMLGPLADFVVGLLAAVATAVLLRYILKKGQSWFTHEQLPLVIFGLPALSAIALRHHVMSSRVDSSGTETRVVEHAFAYASVAHALACATASQCLRIKSGYLFANMGLLGLFVLVINEIRNVSTAKFAQVHFVPTYMIWTAASIMLGTEAITAFLDIFVPLVGRMGRDAPGEIIVAVISTFLIHNFLPVAAPFFHRFTRSQQRQIVVSLLIVSNVAIAVFASPGWSSYDSTHPKRTGVQWLYNATSTETSLHVAQLDSGPGYADFVKKIHDRYGFPEHPPVKGGPAQWDILYPVSAFIESENFPIVANGSVSQEKLPDLTIKLVSDRFDERSGYRTMTIEVSHEGILTPVLSFSAEVIAWSFRIAPPVGHLRHYVKANASPGSATFQMIMTFKPFTDDHRLAFSYMGIDKRQLYPGTSERYPGLAANDMFQDMDEWIEAEWNGSMEVLMYGAVCGIVEI